MEFFIGYLAFVAAGTAWLIWLAEREAIVY